MNISVDIDTVRNIINNISFDYSQSSDNYSDEWKTINYINSVFESLNSLQESWEEVKTDVLNYLNDLEKTSDEAIIKIPRILPYVKSSLTSNSNIFNVTSVNVSDGSYLRLRSGKGTDTDVVLELDNSSPLAILDDSDPEWVKVITENGEVGYVKRDFVKVSENEEVETKSPVETPKQKKVVSLNDKNSSLNLRANGTLGSSVISSIKDGEEVIILEDSNSEGFVKVQVGSKIGYVKESYLKDISSHTDVSLTQQVVSEANNLKSNTINERVVKLNDENSSLNFRTEGNINSSVIKTIKNGSVVTVLENDKNGWTKVLIDGQVGYVSSEYLKEK